MSLHTAEFDVEGKRAIVTGASQGIGRTVAETLATGGADVAICSRSQDRVDPVAEGINDDPASGDCLAVECNVRDREAVEAFVEATVEELGGVDVLVNNAGLFYTTALEAATDEEIQRTLRVNLEGTLFCTRAVLPGMIERGEGRIVNVSSIAGTRGSPSDAAYGASKAGMLGLTKSLAKQYTDEGIFSNAVAPGPTKTEMYAEERRPAARERSPIDRLVDPEEVAEAIRLFATTESVTGETLTVDGGISL